MTIQMTIEAKDKSEGELKWILKCFSVLHWNSSEDSLKWRILICKVLKRCLEKVLICNEWQKGLKGEQPDIIRG